MSNNKQNMKLYTTDQVIDIFEKYGNMSAINARNIIDLSESVKLPSDEEIKKHINYLISCRQNLIDNADNIPQHLLEGGCMAFESAIDNARELFLGGKNEADNYYN